MVLGGLHYSDPKGIAKWTKSITDEYLNSILLAVWMQNTSQMAYWQKDSPIGRFKTTIQIPSVMDFTLQEAQQSIQ
jgi:hypothetical protein